MKRIYAWMLLCCCLFSIVRAETVNEVSLTILHTNDFHGASMELLAKRATLIKQIRATERRVLLVDAGDIFTRGSYATYFYGELEFAVMNQLQYDLMVLGNNEFKAVWDLNLARKILFERIRQAKFPILGANLIVDETKSLPEGVKPYIILPVAGIKVGFIGLTSTKPNFYPQFMGWSVESPETTLTRLLPEIKQKSEIVIALTHIGFGADKKLARQGQELTAIIGGDSHTLLHKPVVVNGIPIVQTGSGGRYLGRLDLTLQPTKSGWKLLRFQGKVLDLRKIAPDPEIKKLIEEFIKQRLPDAA